jgi:ligand-binding SRPBCC domain-containing protein
MPTLHITTVIHAPIERVFDLSRSVSLHRRSMDRHREEAVAGKTGGLMEEGESVTWQARHLGKTRRFTSKVTRMDVPAFFCDEMTSGDFKSFRHEHHFQAIANGTVMMEYLQFETPYGWVGRMANRLFLENYIKRLVKKRNHLIKDCAESNQWEVILSGYTT